MEKLGILQRAQARWHAWQDEREQRRMRREVEERRMAGRKPVTPQIVGKPETEEGHKALRLGDESDVFRGKRTGVEEAEPREEETPHRAPILFLNNERA